VAAIDEYCETLPAASGDRGSQDRTRSGTPQPVARQTIQHLRGRGEDGQALAKWLAGQGSPPAGSSRSGPPIDEVESGGTLPPGRLGDAVEQPSSNPLSAVRSAVDAGSETVSPGLGWALTAIAVFMVGIALRRTRGYFAYAAPIGVAEDLTASTFERVIRSWGSFDPHRANERTWILTIARNLVIDHYRRGRLRNTVSLDDSPALLDTLATADDPIERCLTVDELRSWLARLPRREQEVLALRYGADLAATDIADLLDLTAANVHQILSRSLRRLREHNVEAAGRGPSGSASPGG